MKKNFLAIFFGLFLVLIGVSSIGAIFEIWTWSDIWGVISAAFFDGWYSLFLIVPCSIGLFKKGGKLFNLIGVIIGILILLSAQGVVISKNVLLSIVPLLIVIYGLSLMYAGIFGKKAKIINKMKKGNCNHTAIFSSDIPNYSNREYNGGTCTAVFGDIKLDLNAAFINNSCKIKCNSLFSDVDIKLPANVKVVVSLTSIFGGVSNNFIDNPNMNAPVVYITGVCLFGGVKLF